MKLSNAEFMILILMAISVYQGTLLLFVAEYGSKVLRIIHFFVVNLNSGMPVLFWGFLVENIFCHSLSANGALSDCNQGSLPPKVFFYCVI